MAGVIIQRGWYLLTTNFIISINVILKANKSISVYESPVEQFFKLSHTPLVDAFKAPALRSVSRDHRHILRISARIQVFIMYKGFSFLKLGLDRVIWIGKLPNEFFDNDDFETLWQQHPENHHVVKIFDKEVKTPRWQQAYGRDYQYTDSTNHALQATPQLNIILDWAKQNIDKRLNGLLVNWYDCQHHKHYIGNHRDSVAGLLFGAPIITVSFGEERIFRIRPYSDSANQNWPEKRKYKDLVAASGTVFIMPYETNINYTHEVPYFKKYCGQRISVSLRAFV